MAGKKTTITMGEKLAGIQIQTSTYGNPIPLVYGTNRVAANLIWHDDFITIKHKEKQKGGKGGGGGITQESYTYTASIMLALCEGPVTALGRVWVDKAVGALNSNATGTGWSFFSGERSQAAWTHLQTKHPSKAIGYGGTALVANPALDLGTSGSLKNHSFEVTGFLAGGVAGLDANPGDIVPDFLTNPIYGAGWPATRIASVANYKNYCQAMGFFISPAFSEQRSATEHIEDVLRATNSAPVWSDGKLKIIPYGDEVVAGNGATYTPNLVPLYDLDDDDFLPGDGGGPVQVSRRPSSDAFNAFPIEFVDRSQDYVTNVAEEPDPVDAELYGVRRASQLSLPMITNVGVAQRLSRILAQRSVYTKNQYTFNLPWRFVLIEPMDLLTLTDPFLGLDKRVVRVLEVEENEDGELRFLAEEWPFGIANAALFDTQDSDGTSPDVQADPGACNPPAIFEPPMLLTDGVPELWLATSGGELWGGCEVWLSSDNATYYLMGSIAGPARHGELTASLPVGAETDTVNTLAVQLEAGGELSSVSAQDRDDLVTLSWVDGELIAYRDATLTGLDTYDLEALARGCYGTAIQSHAVAAPFVRLDGPVFRYQLPTSRVGSTLWIKLLSYNIWGGGKQQLEDVSAYAHLVGGGGVLPPGPTSCALVISTTKPV